MIYLSLFSEKIFTHAEKGCSFFFFFLFSFIQNKSGIDLFMTSMDKRNDYSKKKPVCMARVACLGGRASLSNGLLFRITLQSIALGKSIIQALYSWFLNLNRCHYFCSENMSSCSKANICMNICCFWTSQAASSTNLTECSWDGCSQIQLSCPNQLVGNSNFKVVTAHFTTQTLHKVKND